MDEAADIAKIDTYTASKLDEKPVSYISMASSLMNYPYGGAYYTNDPDLNLPAGLKIAAAQNKVIERVAAQPCVIVGRCADYVLRDRDYVFKVFFRADIGKRVERCMELFGLDATNAKKLIRQTDKIRTSYYNGHTQQTWGDPANYDLVLDGGRFGIPGATQLILAAVKALDEK